MKIKQFIFSTASAERPGGIAAREGDRKRMGLTAEQKEELTNLSMIYALILIAVCFVAAAVSK